MIRRSLLAIAMLIVLPVCLPGAEPIRGLPEGTPDATIDLMTEQGLQQVKGEWRYSDVKVIPSEMRGTTEGVYDYTPRAGAADFDDSSWPVVPLDKLTEGHEGKISFDWYRINITIPERVGSFDATDATVVFVTTIDDYSEIWVNGELPRWLGQTGGGMISGFNVPNRLVIGRHVKPGQKIQVAVFGINGPISAAPANTVFMRKGTRLEFYRSPAGPVTMEAAQFDADVDELDKAIVPIVGPIEPKLYKLADGFRFNGGAVWSSEGYLLLADMEANTIYKYSPKETSISVFRNPSDNSGPGLGESSQPRPNGLAFDPQGQLTIAQEGNRRVIRLGKDGSVTVLAESYQNKPLNGPHGLVYRSDGTLYFTDPRSGMPKWFNGQPPDLPYSGVYSIYKGKLQLVSKDPKTPFGIALSPDEKHLYVVDHSRWIVMRYEANADGTLSNGKVFFDMTSLRGGGYACGIAVDQQGNVFVTGRGGVQVISSEGKLLGTINAPNKPRDLAWDGNTLYLSSPDALYFMWMGFPGVRPVGKQP